MYSDKTKLLPDSSQLQVNQISIMVVNFTVHFAVYTDLFKTYSR